jgi:hypothetical protein
MKEKHLFIGAKLAKRPTISCAWLNSPTSTRDTPTCSLVLISFAVSFNNFCTKADNSPVSSKKPCTRPLTVRSTTRQNSCIRGARRVVNSATLGRLSIA